MCKKIIFFSLLLSVFLFSHCGKLKLNPNAFYQSDFPISLNSYWEYERTDSSETRFEIDTVVATITEEGVDLDEKNLWELVWRKKSGELEDSHYLKFRNNNLIFYRRPNPYGDYLSMESHYKFPFKPDDDWKPERYGGIYEVHENVEDPTFGDAFRIKRSWHPDRGETILEDILIGKDIGIIERKLTYCFGDCRRPNVTTFRLLSYRIEE